MYKKIQFLLKKSLRSLLRDYKNFFSIISKYVKVLLIHPLYYSKEYLNVLNSLVLALFRRNFDFKKIYRKLNGLIFEFDFQIDIYSVNNYLGIFQSDMINILLKYLKRGDVFYDIGANIGYITTIAAGIVGKKGRIYSFEPIPRYFKRLQNIALLNKKYNFNNYNFALGDTIGEVEINLPKEKNIGHNSMVQGMIKKHEIKETIKIKVRRLDNFIIKEKTEKIALIKIDVEGFEFPVLKGLTTFFEHCKENLPPIIVEITPQAYILMNSSLEELELFMKNYSYYAYTSDGKNKIDLKKIKNVRVIDILFLNK